MRPADPAARALARWIVAEMHSGFGPLRNDCPMQLAAQVVDFSPSDKVCADLARIEDVRRIIPAAAARPLVRSPETRSASPSRNSANNEGMPSTGCCPSASNRTIN